WAARKPHLPPSLILDSRTAAEDALALWKAGDVLAAPPTLFMLEVLSEHGPAQGIGRLIRHGDEAVHPNRRFLDARPGIMAVPLVTPTLPPARETISYLLGKERVAIVDVGSPFESEINRLIVFLETMQRDFGKTLVEIWLTHHHPDHVWGVARIQERFGIPIRAHEKTAARLQAMGLVVDNMIQDGQQLAPGGTDTETFLALHTPGHADGHLVFVHEKSRTVVAGDLVAGIGTIMIDPDEGDMGDYIDSLRRVLSLNPKTLLPSHGPVIENACSRLNELIEHRLRREDLLEKLWHAGTRSVDSLVMQAYTDVSPKLHAFAARQAQAHLIKLRREGRISGPEE
ncbi:MBL fold metallo-hydrolase, partial [bacterium]|nr:MBL fold metallo-hydrolase [bacterium]